MHTEEREDAVGFEREGAEKQAEAEAVPRRRRGVSCGKEEAS